jgi:3-hydroxybutyrate dehydrogenase
MMAANQAQSESISLQGKVAVVTGAASGIGLAIARDFAAHSAAVVLADIDSARGETATAELSQQGATVYFVQTDIGSRAGCRELIERTVARYGSVDILVNNAGIQKVSPIEEFPEEIWDRIISIMLTGAFLLTRYAIPYMYQKGWGRIINISSIHGLVASANKAAYVSAKHGLMGLTKVVALEAAAHGVTCNAICPSYVRTPLVEAQIGDQARVHGIPESQVIEKIMLQEAALKRLLEPAEVASLARYLCSDMASGITGAALTIDCGWTAH